MQEERSNRKNVEVEKLERRHKKAAAQAERERENAEAQAKNENAAAEAKSVKTDAEAEEVEGTCTGTMVIDGVETTGEAGEEHSELSMVIEESDHIVGEEHHARCVHSDEEAGSIVSRVSR